MSSQVSVAIPTYQRGAVVLETVAALTKLAVAPAEILLIDQTPEHPPKIELELERLDRAGTIRWIRQQPPSIPKAMNRALADSRFPIVLFLDDDIIPGESLVAQHLTGFREDGIWAVVGQVLQPGEEPSGPAVDRQESFATDLGFTFSQNRGAVISNVMAGNLSVRRDRALSIGGFDENFIGVAYRFETDFAHRINEAGGKIWFEPAAGIRHLRALSGGTRAYGNHLQSLSPMHSVGDYYFALTSPGMRSRALYMLVRPFREVRTRFHLTHPWWIVPKLIGEVRGFLLARRLARGGRKLMIPSREERNPG